MDVLLYLQYPWLTYNEPQEEPQEAGAGTEEVEDDGPLHLHPCIQQHRKVTCDFRYLKQLVQTVFYKLFQIRHFDYIGSSLVSNL